ncbi:hypothetical protein ALC57_00803 [Trachymyrmex cornetzi]|uniref:Uncharacterized protein n=1 Tax=Trachymyrmex cornetzi TaxID=471704 RepID=A0A151JQY1_9HYME|nr:hypothetical protein ALC57_00803 [Trachymyrmex cornetzi]
MSGEQGKKGAKGIKDKLEECIEEGGEKNLIIGGKQKEKREKEEEELRNLKKEAYIMSLLDSVEEENTDEKDVREEKKLREEELKKGEINKAIGKIEKKKAAGRARRYEEKIREGRVGNLMRVCWEEKERYEWDTYGRERERYYNRNGWRIEAMKD